MPVALELWHEVKGLIHFLKRVLKNLSKMLIKPTVLTLCFSLGIMALKNLRMLFCSLRLLTTS